MHIRLRNILAAAGIALTMLLPAGAQADLSRVNLKDGKASVGLAHDSATGLDWLDVRLTVNKTYDQVRTGRYYALGFRHATKAELQALFARAGIPDDGFDIAATHPAQALALVALLGETARGRNSRSTLGLVGTDYFDRPITAVTHPVGKPFAPQLGRVQYLDLASTELPVIGEAHFTGGHAASGEASEDWGSFLVRPATCRTSGNGRLRKCPKVRAAQG